MAAGTRGPHDFDVLWRRACLEIEAMECEADGQEGRASYLRRLSTAMGAVVAAPQTPEMAA